MGYQEAVKRIWHHTEGILSDEAAVLKEIVRYAILAPSGHNTQCWRFRIENRSIAILPDLSRRTPVVDPDDHHLYVCVAGLRNRKPYPGGKSAWILGEFRV